MKSVGLLLIRTPTSLEKYNLDLMRDDDDDDDDWRNFNSFHSPPLFLRFLAPLHISWWCDHRTTYHSRVVDSALKSHEYLLFDWDFVTRRAAAKAAATLDQWKVVFARLKGAKGWERLTVWLMIPGKTQRGLYTQIDTLKEFFFFKANERMVKMPKPKRFEQFWKSTASLSCSDGMKNPI